MSGRAETRRYQCELSGQFWEALQPGALQLAGRGVRGSAPLSGGRLGWLCYMAKLNREALGALGVACARVEAEPVCGSCDTRTLAQRSVLAPEYRAT